MKTILLTLAGALALAAPPARRSRGRWGMANCRPAPIPAATI
ncbi:hypothetical protein [Gluconacetobacter azotocaptans]|nr:hypothetical protein [Gluconacetobacter azotocaptans]